MFGVVHDFPRAEAFGGDDTTIVTYPRPDLIINDDMCMKRLPKRSGGYLFGVFMRRHQTRSTIMTGGRC